MFWVNNMEVGDSFRDASSYVTDLAPGTYVLELMNQVS